MQGVQQLVGEKAADKKEASFLCGEKSLVGLERVEMHHKTGECRQNQSANDDPIQAFITASLFFARNISTSLVTCIRIMASRGARHN